MGRNSIKKPMTFIAAGASMILPIGDMYMVEEGFAERFLSFISGLTPQAVVKMRMAGIELQKSSAPTKSEAKKNYTVKDGIAYVNLHGPMTKTDTCMSDFMPGASTTMVRMALREAARDPEVKERFLHIDSPGGDVDGAFDLANDIWKAQDSDKPIYAYIEDMGASAAYLAASQCSAIFANENSVNGSIGVYTKLTDSSGAAKKAGVVVHRIRAGSKKGIGMPNVPVSTADIEATQKRVDSLQALFVKAVARGREMNIDQLSEVADGEVFIGQQGVDAGLIDQICSLEEAHQAVLAMREQPSERIQAQMSANKNQVRGWLGQPQVATDPGGTPATQLFSVGDTGLSDRKKGMLQVLKAANIRDAVQLQEILSSASAGQQALAHMRERVSALAVVALGAETAISMDATIKGATFQALTALGRDYLRIGQERGVLNADGSPKTRKSAPGGPAPVGQIGYGPHAQQQQQQAYGQPPTFQTPQTMAALPVSIEDDDDPRQPTFADAQGQPLTQEQARIEASKQVLVNDKAGIYSVL